MSRIFGLAARHAEPVTLADFPGAPPDAVISEEGWLVTEHEAWTVEDWALTSTRGSRPRSSRAPQPVSEYASLTPREVAILRAFPRLGLNTLIAGEFGISQQTIKNHASSILAKMGCTSIGQAAAMFDRWDRNSWPAVDRRWRDRRQGERRVPS